MHSQSALLLSNLLPLNGTTIPGSSFGPPSKTQTDPVLESIWANKIVGLAVTDSRGNFVNVNSTFCTIVGKNAGELIGKPFWNVWRSGLTPERLQRAYDRRFHAHQLKTLVERRLILWSGETIDLEVSGAVVSPGPGRKFLLTMIRDVTSKKEAERALQASEARFRDLFELAVQPMYQTSVDGLLIRANRAFVELFGFSSTEEAIGIDVARELYVDTQDREDFTRLLKAAGSVVNMEIQLRKRTGETL